MSKRGQTNGEENSAANADIVKTKILIYGNKVLNFILLVSTERRNKMNSTVRAHNKE